MDGSAAADRLRRVVLPGIVQCPPSDRGPRLVANRYKSRTTIAIRDGRPFSPGGDRGGLVRQRESRRPCQSGAVRNFSVASVASDGYRRPSVSGCPTAAGIPASGRAGPDPTRNLFREGAAMERTRVSFPRIDAAEAPLGRRTGPGADRGPGRGASRGRPGARRLPPRRAREPRRRRWPAMCRSRTISSSTWNSTGSTPTRRPGRTRRRTSS